MHSTSALVSGHDFQEEHKTTILSIQNAKMELSLLTVTVLDVLHKLFCNIRLSTSSESKTGKQRCCLNIEKIEGPGAFSNDHVYRS